MFNRRQFLKSSSLLALSTAVTLSADPAVEIEKFRQDLLKIEKPEVKDIDLTKAPDFKPIKICKNRSYRPVFQIFHRQELDLISH